MLLNNLLTNICLIQSNFMSVDKKNSVNTNAKGDVGSEDARAVMMHSMPVGTASSQQKQTLFARITAGK